MEKLTVHTSQREEMVAITSAVQGLAAQCGWRKGAIHLFCPHTTCGLTINEGADADVCADLLRFFQEIAPRSHGWRHREGNTDAHIRASLLGDALLIPIDEGKLLLGTWQAIYLYEGDGPRRREVWAQLLK